MSADIVIGVDLGTTATKAVAFSAAGVALKVRIKTLPGEQGATGRLYSELVKDVCDEREIKLSFP